MTLPHRVRRPGMGAALALGLLTKWLAGCAGGPGGAVSSHPTETPGRVRWEAAGAPVLEFQADPTLPAGVPERYRRGGYVARVFTPSGVLVTDDFPTNHIHHHGIWAAWTKTVFEGRHPDFWNMGDGTGRVQFDRLLESSPGHVRSRHRYVDMTVSPERSVLGEDFDVRLRAPIRGSHPAHVFDVTLAQECLTSSALELPEYRYGGLGFRGRREWDGAARCLFLTSEGRTNRESANATAARWCYIGGKVGEGQAGIAILCHPSNFRAPQPMRLHPTEPFFCYAPPVKGVFRIDPGKPYVARYRCVAFDGPPDRGWLDQVWREYAAEPTR